MSYYNWDKIAQKYSDKELTRIYREKYKEPKDKVIAVETELINRGLLSSDKKALIIPQDEIVILDIADIKGKTKANRKQADFAVLAIGMVLLLYIGSSISSIMQYDLLTNAKEGIVISEEVANNNDHREMIIGIVVLVAYVISSILFLWWFYNAYGNLGHRISKTEFTSGWSIGAWFVPIISLYRPFNIMNELDKRTNQILKKRGIILKQNKNSLIALWWGLFVVTLYISEVFLKLSLKADTIDNYIWMTMGDIFISIVGIILAFVTIIMIKNFAVKEDVLFEGEINTIYTKDQIQ